MTMYDCPCAMMALPVTRSTATSLLRNTCSNLMAKAKAPAAAACQNQSVLLEPVPSLAGTRMPAAVTGTVYDWVRSRSIGRAEAYGDKLRPALTAASAPTSERVRRRRFRRVRKRMMSALHALLSRQSCVPTDDDDKLMCQRTSEQSYTGSRKTVGP